MRDLIRIVENAKTVSVPDAAWFAGSKVIDDLDEPLLVYHGSVASFSEFTHGNKNGMSLPRRGFYFTDNAKAAREFGPVRHFYLSIKHPADFRYDDGQVFVDRALAYDTDLAKRITAAVTERYGPGNRVSRLAHMGMLQTDAFIMALAATGCDGMFFDDNFAGHDFTSFVAFNPDQIRLATLPSSDKR